jgi:hypothetical protein
MPDVTQMRRELVQLGVIVKCTKPGWQATRTSDNCVIISGRKMRHVITQAYQQLKKG